MYNCNQYKIYAIDFEIIKKLLVTIIYAIWTEVDASSTLQYVIKAPKTGVISRVLYEVGDTVSKGAALVTYE